jgi:hypothetical protein
MDAKKYLESNGFIKDGGGVWINGRHPLRFKQFSHGSWMILWEESFSRTSLGEFEELNSETIESLWRILIDKNQSKLQMPSEIQTVADKYREIIAMYFNGLDHSHTEVVDAIRETEEYVTSLLTDKGE